MENYDLKNLLDNIPDGVSIIDNHMRIEWVNKALNGKGFLCENVVGRKCYFVYKQRRVICKHCPTIKVFTTGKTIRIHERGADGKHYEVTAIPIKSSEGEVEKVIEIVREIKRQKRFAVSSGPAGGVFAFVVDPKAKFVSLNNTATKALGYSEDELIGTNFIRAILKEDAEKFKINFKRIIKGKQFPSFRIRMITKKKKIIPVEMNCNPFYSKDSFIGVEIVAKDLTALAKAEEEIIKAQAAVVESEEKYRSFVHNFQGIAYKASIENGIPILFDGDVKKITGYDVEDFISGKLRWEQIIFKEDFKEIKDSWKKLASLPGYSIEREYRIIRKDGEIRWLHEMVQNISINAKNPEFLQGTLHDITEKKKAQKEIELQKAKAEKYLNLAGTMLVALDKKGNVSMINKKGNEVLGYKNGELIGKNWFDKCVPKSQRNEVKKVFKNCMGNGMPIVEHYENAVITKKWGEKTISWHNVNLTDEQGNITGTLSSGEDITEKIWARQQIHESKRKYRTIFELSPEAIIVLDEKGIVSDVNQSTLSLTGYKKEEFVGKNILNMKFISPKSRKIVVANFKKRIAGKNIKPYTLEFITKKGQKRIGRLVANIVLGSDNQIKGIIAIISDITEIMEAMADLKKECKVD